MIYWKALRSRIIRLLDDTNRDAPSWTDDDLRDYVNLALKAVTQHTALQARQEVTADAELSSLPLRDDFFEIGPVSASSNNRHSYLEAFEPKPGYPFPESSGDTPALYYEWPTGTLNFLPVVPVGGVITVHYYAYWPEVDGEDDNPKLGLPNWMEEPLYWYCIAQAMSKPGVQAASLQSYKTRFEAGNTGSNPLLEFSTYAMRRYERLMAEHPSQDRSGWEARLT